MMNLNKLSRAGEKIRLSDDAKKRIIAACTQKLPDNAGEYTDIVMTVERYKPRPFRRFAAIAAVCVLAAGGTAAAVSIINKAPDISSSSRSKQQFASPSTVLSDTIGTVSPVSETAIGEFLANDFIGNGGLQSLSATQRENIRGLFADLTATETEPFSIDSSLYTEDGVCTFPVLQYNGGDCNSHISVIGDTVKYTYAYGLTGQKTYRYYKLDKNIEAELKQICDTHFLFMLDGRFYPEWGYDIDQTGRDEINALFNGLHFVETEDVPTGLSDGTKDGTALFLRDGGKLYQINVFNNYVGFHLYTDTIKEGMREDLSILYKCTDSEPKMSDKLAAIVKEHRHMNNVAAEDFQSDVANTDKYSIWCVPEGEKEYQLTEQQEKQLSNLFKGLTLTLRMSDSVPSGPEFTFYYEDREDCNIKCPFKVCGNLMEVSGLWFRTNNQNLYDSVLAIIDWDAYEQKRSDEALEVLLDVFRNRSSYDLLWAPDYKYPLEEISDEKYAAVAELMNSLEYTDDTYWSGGLDYSDAEFFKHAVMIVYRDSEHPNKDNYIYILDDHVDCGNRRFKTNEPELYQKVQDILKG